MGPTGPCFITGGRGYFDLEEHYSSQQDAKLHWAIGSHYGIDAVYDCDGMKWVLSHIESDYKRSWWLLLLAYTVYDPSISVTVRWCEPTP
jgi:hypothetical protein